MNLRQNLFLILIIASLCCSATDLNRAAVEIAMRNPALAATAATLEAELEDARAQNVLEGPEAEFDYKFSAEGNDGNRWGVSVGQSFDWPGVYSARRKATQYRAEAFSRLYLSELSDRVLDAKIAIINLMEAQKQLDILVEADKNLALLTEAYKRAEKNGQATALEIKKLQLEQFTLGTRIAEARATAVQCAAALRSMNDGDDPEIPAEFADAQLAPLEHYERMWRIANPTLEAQMNLFKAAEADVTVARRSALPSFRIAFAHDYEDRTHFNGISLAVSLPTWNRSHAVRAAQAMAKASEASSRIAAIEQNVALSKTYEEARTLSDRTRQAASAFAGNDYCQLLRKALDMGLVNLFDYIKEYNAYLEAEAGYTALRASLARATATLDRYQAYDVSQF